MRASLFLDGKLGRRRGQVNALGGLVYLQDDKSKQKFLVDTGAAVSVLPHKQSSTPTGPVLAGADGKTIPSWGSVTRSLSLFWYAHVPVHVHSCGCVEANSRNRFSFKAQTPR